MQKLKIIWKKAEKVQAEAIASKFEINRKDKKMAAWKRENLINLPLLARIALGQKHKTICEQFRKMNIWQEHGKERMVSGEDGAELEYF